MKGTVIAIEINVLEESRIVELWLTNSDKQNETLMESVRKLCAEYKAEKYVPAVYLSGEKDLFKNTASLLIHNQSLN